MPRLADYVSANGFVPSNVSQWINDEFRTPEGDLAGLDGWGRPFDTAIYEGHHKLRSWGPDGEPGTNDDLVMTIR